MQQRLIFQYHRAVLRRNADFSYSVTLMVRLPLPPHPQSHSGHRCRGPARRQFQPQLWVATQWRHRVRPRQQSAYRQIMRRSLAGQHRAVPGRPSLSDQSCVRPDDGRHKLERRRSIDGGRIRRELQTLREDGRVRRDKVCCAAEQCQEQQGREMTHRDTFSVKQESERPTTGSNSEEKSTFRAGDARTTPGWHTLQPDRRIGDWGGLFNRGHRAI